jgi:hypothetical protein
LWCWVRQGCLCRHARLDWLLVWLSVLQVVCAHVCANVCACTCVRACALRACMSIACVHERGSVCVHVHLRACAFAFTRTLSVLSQMIGARTIAGPRLHALMHRPASLYTWTHTHELRERERERERERRELSDCRPTLAPAYLPPYPYTYTCPK